MKKLLGVLLSLALLCTFAPTQAQAATTLTWWDQFATLQELHQGIFDTFEAETGVHVDYQNYDAASLKESIDLAIRSGQSPNIFTQMWGSNQEVAKWTEGVFAPLTVTKEELPQYVQDVLYEGYTLFDGQVYSFPTMHINHNALLWYNSSLVEEVPNTLADLRETFKGLTNADENKFAIALPLTDTNRMNDIIRYITAASGGNREFDYHTGEYDLNSETIKTVFQWMVDIFEDGSVHPASTTLKTRTVRERWVNGEVVFAIDGTWYPGSVRTAFGEEALANVAVHKTPVIDEAVAQEKGMVGVAPPGGTFYVGANCPDNAAATKLLLNLLEDDYAVALANAMDQPPLNIDAVAKADVVPAYVDACNIMRNEMGFYPEPQLRNQNVGEVYAELMEIKPNLGDIYVGYVTGALSDWETAVDNYNAAMNAELDRAIETCQSYGVEVDRTDWIFPNYVQGEAYAFEKYAELE